MTDSKPILEGIVQRRCVEAIYNRMRMRLAPHILYTKHDDLFVDAVVLERDGKVPAELKLGTFKLTGLQISQVLATTFDRFAAFDPAQEKYAGVTLLAVE
jgi:hypothetical protein